MEKCPNQALFRFTWPGRGESFICIDHAPQLQGVAQAMGLYLQLIPLSGDEQMGVTCTQGVRANTASSGQEPAGVSESQNS